MTDTTYVYESMEVKLTGREAVKTTSSGNQFSLYEITPVDGVPGPKWLKWVKFSDLYAVLPPKPTPPKNQIIKEGETPND